MADSMTYLDIFHLPFFITHVYIVMNECFFFFMWIMVLSIVLHLRMKQFLPTLGVPLLGRSILAWCSMLIEVLASFLSKPSQSVCLSEHDGEKRSVWGHTVWTQNLALSQKSQNHSVFSLPYLKMSLTTLLMMFWWGFYGKLVPIQWSLEHFIYQLTWHLLIHWSYLFISLILPSE